MSAQAVGIMLAGLVLLASTVRLVRLQLLSIRYGLGWMAVALAAIVGAPLLDVLSEQVEEFGFTPTGFSLGIFILFLGLVCLQLSMSVSALNRSIQDLGEYSALVERRLAELEERHGDG